MTKIQWKLLYEYEKMINVLLQEYKNDVCMLLEEKFWRYVHICEYFSD